MNQETLVDLISQKAMLQEINLVLKKRLEHFELDSANLQYDKLGKKLTLKESSYQDKKVLTGLINKQGTNNLIRNGIIVSTLCLLVFAFVLYLSDNLSHNSDKTPLKTQYLIQNLKSNSIDTWKPWHIVDHQMLNVNIINTANISQEKINAIKDAILSNDTVRIDNLLLDKGSNGATTYYKGWQGAMLSTSQDKTKFHIPARFNVIESSDEGGDITITLSNLQNPDGYSGYTQTTTDDTQTLKSAITIYNVNKLSTERLSAIVRHEFGHSLGLGHSSDQEDLMHYIVETNFPFISKCDISSVRDLYDGKNISDITCL